MSAETVFLNNISKVKKLVFFDHLNRMVLFALLIFLCSYTVATGLEKAGISYVRGDVAFYMFALAGSLIVSLVYTYFTKKRFIRVLIEIDQRLDLKDRISTAYEYQQPGKTSEFKALLVEDAGQRLSLLTNKQLFPPKLSYLHLLIGILIVFNIALGFVDRVSSLFERAKVDQEHAQQISTVLKKYTRTQKPEAQEQNRKEARERIQERLNEMTKKLEEQQMTREKLVQSVNKTLQEVQGEQNQLAKDLNSKLDTAKTQDMRIRKILQSPQLSQRNLEKLREMLNKMLDNQIPDFIEQDLNNLEEMLNLEAALGQILKDIESEESESGDGEEADEGGQADQDTKQDTDDAQQGDTDTQDAEDGAPSQGSPPWEEGVPGQEDFGQYPYNEGYEGMEGEGDQSNDGSSEAGRGKSDGQMGEPSDLEDSQGPVIQDKTTSGPKNDYNIHIRSVTEIGKANLPEEDVTRSYQQEIESILQKEDIPLNYREYIKNYFISIGLRKGDE